MTIDATNMWGVFNPLSAIFWYTIFAAPCQCQSMPVDDYVAQDIYIGVTYIYTYKHILVYVSFSTRGS